MSAEEFRARAKLFEIEQLEEVLADTRARILSINEAHDTDLAAEIYRARRQRDRCFKEDSDLFGEPAWDLLLDLYSARLKGRAITVSSACIAACVPATTALRHLGNLEARSLIVRRPDPGDSRRSLVAISDHGAAIMRGWLERNRL